MMIETYTDGFFYHPERKRLPARIASGQMNPRLDDVFALAIEDTKRAQSANGKRKGMLLARLEEIRKEIEALDEQALDLDRRLGRQHEVIAKYQTGDNLSDEERELLTPECDAQARDERREEVAAEFKAVAGSLPEGWEEVGHRIKDGYIYVTVRRERPALRPKRKPLRQRIVDAMSVFFSPDFKREERVQYWDRLGSLGPINPGAG